MSKHHCPYCGHDDKTEGHILNCQPHGIVVED